MEDNFGSGILVVVHSRLFFRNLGPFRPVLRVPFPHKPTATAPCYFLLGRYGCTKPHDHGFVFIGIHKNPR